ncbi:MAG TPA: hypothetical protein VLM85_07555 [Polyangiaceae bacterium]|nr:hypothetical protein [Polyangiaceae bacterium]
MTSTEPLDASVTLDEIFAVVAQKRVPLAPELAGYLVLELAEGAGNAGEIDSRYVYVSEEGTVALVRGPQEPGGDAETSLRKLLGRLLETAGAQTPSLASVARRKGGAGVAPLVEELEAALIPVNRSAGKRALARLARETKRVTQRVGRNASAPHIEVAAPREEARAASPLKPGTLPLPNPPPRRSAEPGPAAQSFGGDEDPTTARRDVPPGSLEGAVPPPPESASDLPTVGISRDELDAAATKARRDSVDSLLDSFEVSEQRGDRALSSELKKMAGLSPTPPPASSEALESLLAESATNAAQLRKPTGKESPAARRSAPAKAEVARTPAPARKPMSSTGERQMSTEPSQVKRAQLSLTGELARAKGRGPGVGVFLLVILVFGGFAVAMWLVKPGFFTGRTPEQIASERAAAAAESARLAAGRAAPACHATLIVQAAPKDAEILIREGQAPVDIDHMPAGARLEFVATAEGYAPKRAIIPAGAAWDSTGGKPRFDLPIQLDKSRARPGTVDLWPAGEPGSEVGGKGAPGVVHVLSSPKGAEVWLLAGLGPDAQIEDIVACDTDVDVLVAGPTTFRKRLHVPASSFINDATKAGVRTARVSVK